MRVIAGEAKGRRLKAPTSGTRPMADHMREALFSALGPLNGAEVLDLYAGSGSLGLEALSRGASRATFVESAREAILKLEQNVEVTGFGDRAEVEWGEVASVLARPAGDRIGLIFVDPPYTMPATSVQTNLEAIVMGGWLADDGRIVVHRPAKDARIQPLGLALAWERDYGQSHIYVFTHDEET
ncbi:MAG: 16S rRNA (guanine(966)-N(2))-methyltransferase RsmD [Actinomycetota bacterium]